MSTLLFSLIANAFFPWIIPCRDTYKYMCT